MLEKLSVKNFAIIEDIELDFKSGLTVLTGETGAGKSLIIDSIHLLIGERASLEMIRNGKDKATITGVFTFKNKMLEALLNTLDISYLDNRLEITRIISPTKSVIKVNDVTISLNELRDISKYLADIHQQFDLVKLLNKENYLAMIDGMRYDLVKQYLDKYLSSLDELKEKEKEYLSLENKINEIKERRDIYEYELKELSAFNLSPNEEDELISRIDLLKHYDEIYALLEDSRRIIDKESLGDIYNLHKNIEKLSNYQSEYVEQKDKINDIYYELEAIYDEIKHRYNRLDYNPGELDELETRHNEINLLKKKYKKSVPELISYQKELEEILSHKEDMNNLLIEKRGELSKKYHETYLLALDLVKVRKEIARSIEKDLINNLSDLALKVNFEISFIVPEEKEDLLLFKSTGVEEVDFLIETNIGEGLKPLAKIVSGGEMSRINLAFKALFIKSQKVSTVIFDEVDTGISGEIARKVANKIKDISLSTQVIAITHLPQVASLSEHHIKISKHIEKERTYVKIKELNLEEKIYEIANLISDGKVTEKQLEYAKEMVLGE